MQPEEINALFITHEDADHVGCARTLVLRHTIPVWMSRGTHAALESPDFDGLLCMARDAQAIDLGDSTLVQSALSLKNGRRTDEKKPP